MNVRVLLVMVMGWIIAPAFALAQEQQSNPDSVATGFEHPAPQTRPYVYWYWLKDNISREGVTRDLEAMAKVGIGGAFIGHIFQGDMEPGSVKVFSPEWYEIVSHAVREGQRLGVEIGMFNCPGWSQSGGPWITPDKSMRYLASYEKKVTGPARFSGVIETGEGYFKDAALLAFPAPAAETADWRDREPTILTQPQREGAAHLMDGKAETRFEFPRVRAGTDKPFVIEVSFARPAAVQSVVLYPTTANFSCKGIIQSSQDGREYKTIRAFDIVRGHQGPLTLGPLAIGVPRTEARYFRLAFEKVESASKLEVAELELSPRAWVQEFVQKQLGVAWPTPQPMWDAYMWEDTPEPMADSVVMEILNISDTMKTDGTIEWDVPPGEWVLLRLGMRSNGEQNGPASPEGSGLECDKMNREIADFHFDAMIGEFCKRIPGDQRQAFRWVICDSYEKGLQNWTDGFAEKFRQVYGYDPLFWLPVLTGRVVGSAATSERFLWDLRRLVADSIAYDYVGAMREASHRHGLKAWFENYGHWGFPSEFLMYGGQSDGVGGEFWYSTGSLGDIECRAASSAAHIYGKRQVYAEAFTSGFIFNQHPGALKTRGDWAFCQGINHFVLHVYVHQPTEDRPGAKAWFGTNFDRHNTWFEPGRGFIDYLRRCHWMLQQGENVADVAYFIGEDAPKMIGVLDPEIPADYSYDFINGEVLREQVTIKNGRWTLPHGVSYRVLVLPPQDTMRPELLKRIAELVQQGGVLLGQAPRRSPSMQNYPDCDEQVRSLAAELWGQDAVGTGPLTRTCGKGKIYRGGSLSEVMAELKLVPDFEYNTDNGGSLLYVHRTLGDEGEIYFLSNQSQKSVETQCRFRVSGRQPELWDPVRGTRRPLGAWRQEAGLTAIPIAFEPGESAFVVFRRPTSATQGDQSHNRLVYDAVQTLSGPWAVAFDPAVGGPGEVTFDTLTDWTQRPEDGIRYYSGPATYRQTFTLKQPGEHDRLWLDIGQVHDLATVRLNGKELGVVWCAPWRIEITGAVKPGDNRLEIEVVNQWFNRLAGDAALPVEKRITRTRDGKPWPAPANLSVNTPPRPAGLLGPVSVLRLQSQ